MTFRRAALSFLLFVLALVSWAPRALAHPYMLPGGREKDVLALFAPFMLGKEVAAGFALWNVSIEPQRIVVGLREPKGREVRVTLVHPEDEATRPTSPRSSSFVAVQDPTEDPAAEKAVATLIEALARNDRGGLWIEPPRPKPTSIVPGVTTSSPRVAAYSAGQWGDLDGIVALFGFVVLATILAARLTRDEPAWIRGALVAIVLAGAATRFWLSPISFLGAWPWTRLWPNVRAVADGPVLEAIAARAGGPFYLTDVIAWTNFGYAAAMPLVLFGHATYLLRDPRAGLFAAFAVAFLPQHIRFSRCEDAFVPSLVITSLSFALIHAWLRDPSRVFRIVAIACLPAALYTGYLLRPLNILFIVVYMAAVVSLHPETAPPVRRVLGLLVVAGMGMLVFPVFLSTNEAAVKTALFSPGWLFDTGRAFLVPKLFVLTDPAVTPPVLVVLAVAGAILGYRAGERRLVVFLLGWIAIFTIAHAFVMEETMRPRYHLHLVVPFLFLGAIAVSWLWQRRRMGVYVACGALLVAPLLHRGWIQDIGYTEMREHAFVQKAREIVPEGCTVIEYAGADAQAKELRFARIGARARRDRGSDRYRVVPAFAPGVSPEVKIEKPLEELLRDPPACLYLYEGLPCWSQKNADEAYAGMCSELRQTLDAEVVMQGEVPLVMYDRQNTPPGRRDGPNVTFWLSRARVGAR
ncbi:hypothetical protein [Polyangium jinanense]|uniref:Glycosyltransferase RgtA/B/C/D-like domain-containing protein n=1 Tax=Polyangium jinanense TaxID=2829994 RepID=A0A9X3X7J2_9BACT|nr:hypothetical protein [Polyangium jinanense]MDC3962283.1 hypothetical protein [Polyangium jinanense]MDC3985464.1 hypothetical protein [Polyangium jinanense]